MKKIVKIFIVAATAFFAVEATADAQVLKALLNKATSSSTTETVSEATSNGQAAGIALKSLYKQYKADGKKLDLSNVNNLLNLTTLTTNIKGLKGMTNKSTFYKDFAAGLIKGSDNLVNSNNSTSVMSGLTTLVNSGNLSSLTEKASTATSNASDAVSAISNILNLFK